MAKYTEEQLLEKAREIQSRKGITLSAAMVAAEAEMNRPGDIQTRFSLEVDLKPRDAKWVLDTFEPTDIYTREERLAAYVAILIGKARQQNRTQQIQPQIGKGGAVSVPRANMPEEL